MVEMAVMTWVEEDMTVAVARGTDALSETFPDGETAAAKAEEEAANKVKTVFDNIWKLKVLLQVSDYGLELGGIRLSVGKKFFDNSLTKRKKKGVEFLD